MEDYFVYCSDFNSDTPLSPKARAEAKLPTALHAKDGYEIGLLEAHVCAGWANLTNAGVTLEKLDPVTGKRDAIEVVINDTLVDTLERLFARLNTGIEKWVAEDVDNWAK